MSRILLLVIATASTVLFCQTRNDTTPTAVAAPEPAKKPFGIDKRIPWTTSRVVGSPEPPPPYRVKRAFAELKTTLPITVAHEPGTDQLLLINQLYPWVGPGRVTRVADDGNGGQTSLLLSLERTIYGIAFHPDYAKNGYFFIGSHGPITPEDRDLPGRRFRPDDIKKTTRISRFTVDRKQPFACDPASEKVIIDWRSNGHNGGDLAFGNDGMLYISAGDGTFDSDTDIVGQDLTKLTAKVLRIDVDHPTADKAYGIPPDNPFLQVKDARPETWAYGLRNPWRLHIDRKSGDLWVGQNGQDLWEQIYLIERGANYGWSLVEGGHPFLPNRKQGPTPISKPIVDHHHSEARSISGGLVYHGSKLPDLQGAYIYGDWSTGRIWGIRHEKGKVTWNQLLADTTLQITGFGTDSKGELLIVDYGGGLYRLETAPKEVAPSNFPTRLSETGLFKSVKDHQPEAGLIPYSVNAPLWSDNAEKERFIAIPGTGQIDFMAERGWGFPEGTVLVKTFSLAMKEGEPGSRKRIETRLFTRQRGQWAGYTYIWNDEQTEATLVPAAGQDRVFTIDDANAKDGKRQQTWHFPSRLECQVCHCRGANYVLGLTTLQMNKDHDYGGVVDNQLRTFEHLELLRVSSLERFLELKKSVNSSFLTWPFNVIEDEHRKKPVHDQTLPRRPEQLAHLVDPSDERADLTARVRSYLHANCAQCHVRAGGGNSLMDVEFSTPLEKTRMIGVRPQHQDLGLPDPQLIAPGKPDESILYRRLTQRGQGQMPPLASSVVDKQAAKLVRQWIEGMK